MARGNSAMWNTLHNARHPRGTELQRKLIQGHALSDRDLGALYASPTANWWGERDERTASFAARKNNRGHILSAHELSALRSRAASRLPPVVVPDHSPERSRAILVHQPSPSQDALGYHQRIMLENNVPRAPSREEPHPLSAPTLHGPTAEERRAARDDRVRELQEQIRRERRERRRLERSISAPAVSGGTGASRRGCGEGAATSPMPDAWFEERDRRGRPVYVHLDGRRTSGTRPTQGNVYGLLSYVAS